MQPAEYERIVLRELRHILMDPGGQAKNLARRGGTHGGVRVEEIRLDDSGPEHEIALLFRDSDRMECLFGYGVEAVETPDVPRKRSNPYPDPVSAARSWAGIVWVLFEEEDFGCGLPRDCSPGAVTWIQDASRGPAAVRSGTGVGKKVQPRSIRVS